MNLYQCQRLAKERMAMNAEFLVFFPVGPKKCQWLDPYLGLFSIEGNDGFVRVDDIDQVFPGLKVLEVGA